MTEQGRVTEQGREPSLALAEANPKQKTRGPEKSAFRGAERRAEEVRERTCTLALSDVCSAGVDGRRKEDDTRSVLRTVSRL